MEEQEDLEMNELPTKILVSSLPSTVHEEFLEMFFENSKKSGGGPVVSVVYDEETASAIVEFEDPEVVENVLKKHPLKMMGQEISVEVFDPGPVTLRTIEVTGPHDLVCEEQMETLQLYFEHKRSLGDEVKDIVFDGDIALVTFFSEEVARRVAGKSNHKINKKPISVKLHSTESNKLRDDREGFARGEDETVDKNEEAENERALTVKVKVKELPSKDTVENYIDNKRRSGGSGLQKNISDEDDDVLYVKYQSEEGLKMTENLYNIKKVGNHWLLGKADKSFKRISVLTHVTKVQLSDNFLIADDNIIYKIQEHRDDIVLIKIDDICVHEEQQKNEAEHFCKEKKDSFKHGNGAVEKPHEEDTLPMKSDNTRLKEKQPVKSNSTFNDFHIREQNGFSETPKKPLLDQTENRYSSLEVGQTEDSSSIETIYFNTKSGNCTVEHADKLVSTVTSSGQKETETQAKQIFKERDMTDDASSEADIKTPTRVVPPTSRSACITVSNVRVNARIASIKSCRNSEAIIYFWDISKLYSVSKEDKFLKETAIGPDFFGKRDSLVGPFVTGAGAFGSGKILHIPLKNAGDHLLEGFKESILFADKEGCSSATFLFKLQSPFMIYQEKLSDALIAAVKEVAEKLNHLKHITINFEEGLNAEKLFQPFRRDNKSREKDATALSKHDKTQFRFQRFDEQFWALQEVNMPALKLPKFPRELTTFKLTVTDDDLKTVTGLKKQLLNIVLDGPEVEDITASEEDGYEHINLSIMNVEGVTDQMWQLLQEEKKEKIKEFKKCGGTITHNGNLLTLRRQEVQAGDDIMIKDYVSVFSSFVQQMKDMDFVEISSADEHVANILMWKNEIEAKLNKRCCTFLEKQKKIIAYGDSYEEVKQVELFFLFKQGKRKQTARSRKVATADDYSGPASLQSDYKGNQIMFEWNKDARNIKAYKTEEGLQVYVYEADILNLRVDCIVNAANDSLQHGGGVAQVIAKAAGRELTKGGDTYIGKNGPIPVGEVVTTTSGKLPYRSVIHAVGPRWTDYKKTDNCIGECEKDLFNAVYKSCVEADRKRFQSIAFPAFSSAIFGVPGDLCVSQYVKATLTFSKTKLASLKEIHFIDKDSDIVKQIQREFKTVLVDGKESPYQRQLYVKGFGRNRTGKKENSNQAVPFISKKYGHEVPENLRTVPTIQNKGAYFFEENGTVVYVLGKDETKRLLVYKDDLLEVKSAAIVVTVDEFGRGGVLAKGLASKIQKVKMFDIYQKELKRQLSLKPIVGQIAITKGYSTHFSHVFHIIFPSGERLKQPEERRKCLTETYKNVFSAAMKEKTLNIVATALVGIDGKKIEDIDLGCSALWDAYLWHLRKLETESISPLDVHLVCLDENQLKRVQSNFNSYIEMIRNTEPETEDHQTFKKHKTEMSKDQDCVICMEQTENPKVLRCGHIFCTACIDTYFEIKKACPTCGAVCGIITGDQPQGDMKYYFSPYHHCTGYERCGQIIITYTFSSGRQEQTHPNPGAWYEGITRTAYLPDNEEGRKILKMLIVAFRRKLVFTIGRSRTTGKEGVITWNDIHHKTDWRSHSQFGYPDETYLQRVTEQLAAKGVTEKDIVDVIL